MRPSRWFVLLAAVAPALLRPPSLTSQDRAERQNLDRAQEMLRIVRRDIERNYYDSTFHGVNLEARYRAADSAVAAAGGLPEAFAIIADFAGSLRDSHTRFHPPSQVAEVKYGFSWSIVGDDAFVDSVAEDSDAAAKGLARGDKLLTFDGLQVNRQNADLLGYLYYRLRPRRAIHVTAEKPDRTRAAFDVLSRVRQGIPIYDLTTMEGRNILIHEFESDDARARYRVATVGDSVAVVQLFSFAVDPSVMDEVIGRVRPYRALVLDLRGNGGGLVVTERRLLGLLFDRPVVVGTTVTRDGRDTVVAEPRRNPYRGEIVVITDWGSASASEITARVLQLEHRATIVGDRSAGAVMTSRSFGHEVGLARVYQYGVQVSVRDVVMSDGQRLEGHGVIPDVEVLPTPRDLQNRTDPALSVALNLVGVTFSPAEAAQLLRERRRN